jgi:hypothetical protein
VYMNIRDGMRLSATCSTIREDSRIVSIQYAVQQRLRGSFVYVALGDRVVEDAVESECLVL